MVNVQHYEHTLKTSKHNSSWAYIREGLLLEGFLRLRFGGGEGGGLIFGRVYSFILFYFIFFLGGGGNYYRNFTVCQ